MSLVFTSAAFKQDPKVTATHVLIIGCGEYPCRAAAGYPDMQLISPGPSAEAMANWYLSGVDAMPDGLGLPPDQAFYDPDAPLGSLALLTSPLQNYRTPFDSVVPGTLPTRSNIENAYNEWLNRLGQNPNSLGIFYFCGHGVSDGESQFLVADDFGAKEDDIWSAAFHVNNTCLATSHRIQAKLFYVIDACNEFSKELVYQIESPTSLISGSRAGDPLTSYSILRAAKINRLAYAPRSGGVACFTSAILHALHGHCGSQLNGEPLFGVSAGELCEAVEDILDWFQKRSKWTRDPHVDSIWKTFFDDSLVENVKLYPPGGASGKTRLHVLTKRPVGLVDLDVKPQCWRRVAHTFIERRYDAKSKQSKLLGDRPAQFDVEFGDWDYGAEAASNQFETQKKYLFCTKAVAICHCDIPT